MAYQSSDAFNYSPASLRFHIGRFKLINPKADRFQATTFISNNNIFVAL
jgi:hypothetical protein